MEITAQEETDKSTLHSNARLNRVNCYVRGNHASKLRDDGSGYAWNVTRNPRLFLQRTEKSCPADRSSDCGDFFVHRWAKKVLSQLLTSLSSSKRLLNLGFVISTSLSIATVCADYLPLELHDLINGSDMIVEGTISNVAEHSFTLGKLKIISEDIKAKSLKIKKYRDWTGGRRWMEYQSGQSLLLFLTKPETSAVAEGCCWEIRGLGGEGEMPVEGDHVYPHGINLNPFQMNRYRIYQREIYGYQFHYQTFLSALNGYQDCFSACAKNSGNHSKSIVQTCSDSELVQYQNQSALHQYLAKVSIREVQQN